jgi:hypothetical protein
MTGARKCCTVPAYALDFRAQQCEEGAMRCSVVLITVVATLVAAATATATTYVVNPEGTGDMATIQEAVDAADAGDVIELTNGTFMGDGNRDVRFYGKAITVRSQSGNFWECIIDCEGSEGDPHRGFMFTAGETSDSVLEGVTIRNSWTESSECGGAVQCRGGSSPTIANCEFVQCEAGCGGGVWCQSESNPTITDCSFYGNIVSQRGGGLFCTGSSPSLAGCSFWYNRAESGGAVGCNGTSAPTFTNCTVARNFAYLGAAFYCKDTATATITNCTFVANETTAGGRIVLCTEESSVLLENTIIAFSSEGASVDCEDSASASLACCLLYANYGGNWVGCITEQADTGGNLTADPLFCAWEFGGFGLCANSPCASENNTECGQIGQRPVQCQACETPVRSTTWGQIKAWHR